MIRTAWLGSLLVAAMATTAVGQDVRARLVGTWTLVSRTDSGAAGVLPADDVLVADPVAAPDVGRRLLSGATPND